MENNVFLLPIMVGVLRTKIRLDNKTYLDLTLGLDGENIVR